jgi:hypothetical protein
MNDEQTYTKFMFVSLFETNLFLTNRIFSDFFLFNWKQFLMSWVCDLCLNINVIAIASF